MSAIAVDCNQYIEDARVLTDKLLDQYLPSVDSEPSHLHEAMRYSVFAGGKRLRPILALAAFDYCGGTPELALSTVHPAMAGLEMVHTYSLIHDDLPCMDDDDLRRGQPTCHKKFGEAMAVLAGDALHVVAFEMMARTGSVQAVLELAEAVGTAGMIGGQVADMEAEGKPFEEATVHNIHIRKTGALIRGSVRIGAILANADPNQLQRLTVYGERTGLAFQIIDDILDIEGDQSLLGKQVGSDTRNQKATYPAAAGLDVAKQTANDLIEEALNQFESDEENVLTYIARYIGSRNR